MQHRAQDRIPGRCRRMDTHHCRYAPFRRQRHDIDSQPFGYNLPGAPFNNL